MKAKTLQGVKLGRPRGVGKSKLDKYRIEIEALLNNGTSQAFIANHYGATEATVSRWMKAHNIQKPRIVAE